ncbi:MAG: glutamate racemase [Elusimicrobia bacterium]|nr:glutamate racemase [Elusimicrobiota bacterium]
MRAQGVAIFDSGVGGLTVFKEIRRALPAERLVYFGDTARLPYGSKSREAVTRFCLEIARFLLKHDIKMLIVACNSASALALSALEDALDIPVLGVIGPAVRAAAVATKSGTIGVIGTEATINSRAYEDALAALNGALKTAVKACPLLVPLVEEGWWAHPVTERVAQAYLRPLKKTGMDTLILGCTHYPLIKAVIQKAAGGRRVRLIDSGEEMAREARAWLKVNAMERRTGKGSQEFFVSDAPDRFKRLARRFLGAGVDRVTLAAVEA